MSAWDEFKDKVQRLKRKNRKVIFRKTWDFADFKPAPNDTVFLEDRDFVKEFSAEIREFSKRQKRKFKEQSVIDLHGMTVDQAMEAVELFLRKNSRAGNRNVIVITGGSKAVNKAIRATFIDHASRCFSELISIMSVATEDKGKDGAFFIKIRKNRKF